MKLPDHYKQLSNSLSSADVSFGCGGIKLFSIAELEKGQVGYSVASDGASLCSGKAGAWQPNWVVIGYETACGDPLFIDTCVSTLPVFTAIHGEGLWEPMEVASSLRAFARCLEEFSRVSIGRSNPVELEANPVRDSERSRYLRRIAEVNKTGAAPQFWDALLSL